MELQVYDEDLTQNPFYLCLEQEFSEIYQQVTDNRWILCVPRTGCLQKSTTFSEDDITSHILIPESKDGKNLKTLNEKNVSIENRLITTGEGFLAKIVVSILFEETFFNKSDESYRVLCVNQPLETLSIGQVSALQMQNSTFVLRGLDDCAQLLWGKTENKKTQQQIEDLIQNFQKALVKMDGQPFQYYVQASQQLFEKAMSHVLKDSLIKMQVRHDPNWIENIKAAIETIVMHGVFRRLFRAVRTCWASKDAHLNKITRNLRDRLQLKDLGVRVEFCQNVPRARKELANLGRYSTPLGKLHCLRRVTRALTQATTGQGQTIPLSTDDLLPILIFLVIKADMPNWWANFKYMTNFRFGRSSTDDEYGFYLACLEAALEHISSGDVEHGMPFNKTAVLGNSIGPSSSLLWQSQEKRNSIIESFFQNVRDNNISLVCQCLDATIAAKSPIGNETLCHPLCECPQCAQRIKDNSVDAVSITVTTRDDQGNSALHVAAECSHLDLMEELLKRSANVNMVNHCGITPLHIACQLGNQRVALYLLDQKANPNMQDSEGNSPLHVATVHGHDDVVKALVYFDPAATHLDLDKANDFGDRPLHLAAKWGYYTICEILLENGAQVAVRNRKNITPKHVAHNSKVAALLLKAAEDQGHAGSLGASRASRPKPRRHSVPASHKSTSESAVATATSIPKRRLSQYQPRRNSVANSHVEKLLKAVADGDLQMVRYHLGWTEEWEEDDVGSLTSSQLCHPLCQCDKCKPVQRLTAPSSTGLHVNSQNAEGFTPLHIAARHGHYDLTKLFLTRGATVNSKTTTSQVTPLHLAAKHNHVQVVRLLHENKASLDIKDYQGNTPLHYTCQAGSDVVLWTLIKFGAPVNAVNKKGNTALHEATKWNSTLCVRTLIECGVNIHIVNKMAQTALQITQSESVAQLLREALLREHRLRRGEPLATIYSSTFPNRFDAASQALTSPSRPVNLSANRHSSQANSSYNPHPQLRPYNSQPPATKNTSTKASDPHTPTAQTTRLMRRSNTFESSDVAKLDSLLPTPGVDWPVSDAYDEWEDISVVEHSATSGVACLAEEISIEWKEDEKVSNVAESIDGDSLDSGGERRKDLLVHGEIDVGNGPGAQSEEHAAMPTLTRIRNVQTSDIQIHQQTIISSHDVVSARSHSDGERSGASECEIGHSHSAGTSQAMNNKASVICEESIEETMEEILKESFEGEQTVIDNETATVDESVVGSTVFSPKHDRHGSVSSKISGLEFVSDHYESDVESVKSEDSTTESLRDACEMRE